MELLRRWGTFLLIAVLLGAGAALLFWETGGECLSILRTGRGETRYQLAATDGEGRIYALGADRGGYVLALGDRSGGQTERWDLSKAGLPEESVPALLYPAAGGAVYLGLYNTEEKTCLQLYRLTQQGTQAELLLSQSCPGENLQEQMAALRLSDFSEVDGVVRFALLEGDQATFYQRSGARNGLEQTGTVTFSGLQAAVALSDGTQLLAGRDSLFRTDGKSVSLSQGERIIGLTQTGTGVCYVDGAGPCGVLCGLCRLAALSSPEPGKRCLRPGPVHRSVDHPGGGGPAAAERGHPSGRPGQRGVRPERHALPLRPSVRADFGRAGPGRAGAGPGLVVCGV